MFNIGLIVLEQIKYWLSSLNSSDFSSWGVSLALIVHILLHAWFLSSKQMSGISKPTEYVLGPQKSYSFSVYSSAIIVSPTVTIQLKSLQVTKFLQ